MSETFKKFSETLKKSPNETLEILKAAGISGKKEGDTISHEEKIQVIQYLNKGKQASRRQRSTSQLKVMQGKAAKTVSVEVRKKTTYTKAKTTDAAKTSPPSPAKKKSKANKTEAKTVRKKAAQQTISQIPDTDEDEVKKTSKRKKSAKSSKAESAKISNETAAEATTEQSDKTESADKIEKRNRVNS